MVKRRCAAGLAALSALWLVWALWTLPAVPFHPDESTYLYMSADGRSLLRHPLSLVYTGEGGLREHYRLVNAPLTRYLVALGLAAHHQPPLMADWDWSASWEANAERGAVPSGAQLVAARQGMVLCVALAGWLLGLVACRLAGGWGGLWALLAFLLDPLVLLHGRRAMMEAPMLLGIAWLLWEMLAERPSPWRLGAALAWAVWAKYWALALAPLALWVAWRGDGEAVPRRWLRILPVLGVPLVAGFLLQPVLWRQPWDVLPVMWQARWALTLKQQAAFRAVLPAYVPRTPWARLAITLGHLYLAPLAYLDLGKYARPLAAAIAAYRAQPWASWSHLALVAVVRLLLLLGGMGWLARQAWRAAPAERRAARIFLAAAALQWGFLLMTLPLAFQRYTLAVLPFVVVSEAAGAVALGRWLLRCCGKAHDARGVAKTPLP